MELKNFRGQFIDWNSVPDLENEEEYKSVGGSSIPQIGDYILVKDIREYPQQLYSFEEGVSSTDESIVGRVLAGGGDYAGVPAGTLITYEDFLKLKRSETPLQLYKGLSWRLILEKSWDAGEFDNSQTYFIDDVVKFGDTYLRNSGAKVNPWVQTDYVPGKAQWKPYEEVDDSFFSDKALEEQVKANTKGIQRALENTSTIFWGTLELTDEAIDRLNPGDNYELRDLEHVSCHKDDILWLNIINTNTGDFGQMYMRALEDFAPIPIEGGGYEDATVSTLINSFVWNWWFSMVL